MADPTKRERKAGDIESAGAAARHYKESISAFMEEKRSADTRAENSERSEGGEKANPQTPTRGVET